MKLKEEIERIKSLFTEERLFGNLIEDDNPDKDNDKKIDYAEFEDAGSEINIKQAKEFIRASGEGTVLDIEDCDTTVKSVPHLKCIKEALDSDSRFKKIYELFKQSETIGCTFQLTRIKAYLDNTTLNGLITGDYIPSNTKLSLTLWQKGRYKGNKKTFALLMEFTKPIEFKLGNDREYEKVKEVRLRGSLDNNCKIEHVWIAELRGTKKKARKEISHKFDTENEILNLANTKISDFLSMIKT